MTDRQGNVMEGGCTCGAVRYRLNAQPLFVHCCHCTWCQRESGSAFAVNAFIEASQVELLKGRLTQTTLPSASGNGQVFWRCADCGVTVWSNYPQAGPSIHFIRVGTLDDPSRAPPDIHIYTSTKQPWVVIPDGVPAVSEFYRPADYWPAESAARFKSARAATR
ncbi:MAG TPA: GFA family protein [Pseudolabrys sp.]|nr:GFA family protein [Pseudolabrys sp.]